MCSFNYFSNSTIMMIIIIMHLFIVFAGVLNTLRSSYTTTTHPFSTNHYQIDALQGSSTDIRFLTVLFTSFPSICFIRQKIQRGRKREEWEDAKLFSLSRLLKGPNQHTLFPLSCAVSINAEVEALYTLRRQ